MPLRLAELAAAAFFPRSDVGPVLSFAFNLLTFICTSVAIEVFLPGVRGMGGPDAGDPRWTPPYPTPFFDAMRYRSGDFPRPEKRSLTFIFERDPAAVLFLSGF